MGTVGYAGCSGSIPEEGVGQRWFPYKGGFSAKCKGQLGLGQAQETGSGCAGACASTMH